MVLFATVTNFACSNFVFQSGKCSDEFCWEEGDRGCTCPEQSGIGVAIIILIFPVSIFIVFCLSFKWDEDRDLQCHPHQGRG